MPHHKQYHSSICLALPFALSALLAGCFPDHPPPREVLATSPSGGSGGGMTTDLPDAGGSVVHDGKCLPIVAEPLPLRSEVLSATAAPTQVQVAVTEVFNQFKIQCGSCHVETNLGGLQVTTGTYLSALQDAKILERLETDDISKSMPQPTNLTFSKRPDGDPVRKLDRLLNEWKQAGYPPDVFYEKPATGSSQVSYALSTEQGNALTNLGTCAPEATFPFATDRVTMADLDQKFAALMKADAGGDATPQDKLGLPLDLADTDLTSFDSDALARTGVIAFAPAYPLWSDDSGKLRFVRVPLGQSITFDKAEQSFSIPDNTRFYKTFLKKVVDQSGKQRWKKIETRLIVARADLVDADGNHTPQALFGTYEWDEAETHAALLIDTLRNGDPFTDHLFEYETDEPAAAKIRAKKPANLTYELEYAKLLRHYAVPGSNRCMHCHMGSNNGNFILGFLPLQINRRPQGEGGVYEPAAADELTQLQRFIDLGVITGLTSPDDVVKLEYSQCRTKACDGPSDRKPRNEYELKAQAYMLGNCAHCHNENGFPSVASPVLKPLLDFYPSSVDAGGIFQFPLERFSPRISRGTDNSQIAYISPSLRDIMPPANQILTYTNKFPAYTADPNSTAGQQFMNVPWRSLIYRNVQTAFTYSDSLTLYPHMPFDTGGHDCRAAQWLGEWMVSIPAVRKHPDMSENFTGGNPIYQDIEPQPYTEVLPGTAGYDAAVAAANRRLATYQQDPEYSTCPDTSDIVDPDVLAGRREYPHDTTGDGVPDHPNWVVTDLTERKGLWEPRRTDWQAVLATVPPKFPPPAKTDPGGTELDKQKAVVSQLGSAHLSEVAGVAGKPGFADTPFPLALWKQKPGCTFDSQPKVSDPLFAGDARPQWLKDAPADAPVFSVLPGQAVFDMICVNCHGPNADGQGRQADTLQNLTGGIARVANFRFGLFNPAPLDDPYDKPDLGALTNRQRVFGPVATNTASVDDWGARYLAWMALGGTGIQIPQVILDQVARTDVGGLARSTQFSDELSANMLQVAQLACRAVLAQGLKFDLTKRQPDLDGHSPLIVKNGDAELWTQLCSLSNSLRVHKILVTSPSNVIVESAFFPATPCDTTGQPAPCYPATAPVGDERGRVVVGLHPENNFPWCLDPNTTGATLDQLNALALQYAAPDGTPLPICPASWTTTADDLPAEIAWENRGAINAGFSVFWFLDKFIKGQVKHIGYDQCDLLTTK